MEVLLVIAMVGILVALVLPSAQPGVCDQLQATARVVATDLAYGRSLAVANNSTYRYTFDIPNNRYILEHSGPNPTLDRLPLSPFRSPSDPATQHILDLDELPHVGPTVQFVVAANVGNAFQPVDRLEFGPLGGTTASSRTELWFSAGNGDDARYITISVNPVTGLAEVGPLGSDAPPTW